MESARDPTDDSMAREVWMNSLGECLRPASSAAMRSSSSRP